MFPIQLMPDQVEFVLLSFEGPDSYSKAGGLGVRVANLSHFLASQGFRTHLVFIGSPDLPGREALLDGQLQYYRWCQWISRYHPLGVYDGEEGKLNDFNQSVPPFIIDQIACPAISQGRHLVVLAEEWHTAEALIRLSDQLHEAGLRPYSTLLWNANNTMGFERIDWPRLGYVATLTTVSRYMKQIMRGYGLDALIIPNGIPSDLVQPGVVAGARQVRARLAANGELLLFKVGRYDPAKCWWLAVEAAAQLKQEGRAVRFLCRGGIEPHGVEVLDHARALGLLVKDVGCRPQGWDEALDCIIAAGPADLYNLQFGMSQAMLQVFYAASDFVLANSKHEPFGLVGLEAMAAGAVVFTGPTGETYSADGAGAIALDTDEPSELVQAIETLSAHPERAQAIRRAAPRVAARYTWDNVVEVLFEKIHLASSRQGVRPLHPTASQSQPLPDGLFPPCPPPPPALPLPAWPASPARRPVEIPLGAAAR